MFNYCNELEKIAVNDTFSAEAGRGDGTAVTPKIIEATKLQDGQLYGKSVMPMDGGADTESTTTTTTAIVVRRKCRCFICQT